MEAAISLVNVCKSYGSVHALRDVSVEVQPGQFVTLLGPSGSGKTTLLQIIAGFVEPNRGKIYANGQNITDVPAHRRNIGMVFQNYALFPHLSVQDNIAYSLKIRGIRKNERAKRVIEMLQTVEMPGYGSRHPDQLSGGQQQRVALARALVFEPQVVLLDEALSALDRRLRQNLQFTIKRIQRDIGATFIHVTHDQDEALAMSDVIVLMKEGRIEQVGAPAELYTLPKTPFAASFMGVANLVHIDRAIGPGEVVHRDTGERFKASFRTVFVDTATEGPLLCVRPEALRVEPVEATPDLLSGILASQTFMGDHWRYEVRVGSQLLVSHDFQARTLKSQVGDRVALRFPEHEIPLYCNESGPSEKEIEPG